jgi:thiosulfate/3-mercaptopyruvate sulfurtransferase
MTLAYTQILIETDRLAARLDEPDLRILDCTVGFVMREDSAGVQQVEIVSGREEWRKAHLPGSAFVDLTRELKDQSNTRLMFAMPGAEQFSAVMSALGVGPGVTVVLYDSRGNMWAARVWWMLRAFGFDNAMVLNGGLPKWQREGRPLSTSASIYPPAQFVAKPRPQLIASKQEVLAAIGDGQTCILNALGPESHSGADPGIYGRPGRIPSSLNVPAMSLIDPQTQRFLELDVLRERFMQSSALARRRAITYCGGGIAACSAALALTLLGHDDVAVYDGSMREWAADTTLPMETG